MSTLPDYTTYARDVTYLRQLREAIIAHPCRDDQIFAVGRDIEQESIDAVGRDQLYAAISELADIAPTPTGPDPDNDDADEEETAAEPDDPFVAEFTEVLEAYETDDA